MAAFPVNIEPRMMTLSHDPNSAAPPKLAALLSAKVVFETLSVELSMCAAPPAPPGLLLLISDDASSVITVCFA